MKFAVRRINPKNDINAALFDEEIKYLSFCQIHFGVVFVRFAQFTVERKLSLNRRRLPETNAAEKLRYSIENISRFISFISSKNPFS